MLKQTIQFKDFNNKDQERDLYFNLTEAELVDMQADSPEGIQVDMMRAVQEKDMRKLLDFVKMLVHRSYGERDADGIHFHKSPQITANFVNSAMYSPLLLSLFEDEGARTEAFITGLMPADLVAAAIAKSRGEGKTPRPQAMDHLQKAHSTESGPNEATPIRPRSLFENNVEDQGTPAWVPSSLDDVPANAQPLQVDRLEDGPRVEAEPEVPVQFEEPSSSVFRVSETPMPASPAEAKSQDQLDFEEFKRRRDAGEL